MPDYQLHTDYDRNGVLTASASEYAARQTTPGAVLLANLDADGRRLPERVSAGRAVTLDHEQPVRSGSDNDLLPMRVRVVKASAPTSSFFIEVSGTMAEGVRPLDRTGHPLLPVGAGGNRYQIPLASPQLDLALEARTLRGSPLIAGARAMGDVELTLLAVDPAGVVTTQDRGVVTVAPFLMPSNGDDALRLYICEFPGNEPSRRDVTAALTGTSVPIVLVPLDVSGGDAWVQDQFQHGVVQGPAGFMHMIVHLPRLRSNVVQVDATVRQNLATFITSHFPARDVGVFQDFWARSIPLAAADGSGPQAVPFDGSLTLMEQMLRVERLFEQILDVFTYLKRPPPQAPDTWFLLRQALPGLLANVTRALGEAADSARSSGEKALLGATKDDLKRRFDLMDRTMPLQGERVVLPVPGAGGTATPVVVQGAEADRLLERLRQMLGSANFGGNIEVTPPLADAPFGKCVVGNVRFSSGDDFMDPDVLAFLQAQQFQPLIEIDTSWLEVGHVDEVAAFVPAPAEAGGFAALRAAPGVAMALVREARRRYREGLADTEPYKEYWRPSGVLRRQTDHGACPVTMMLRGQAWLHSHPRGALQALLPPRIYRQIAHINSQWIVSEHELYFWPGEGDDRAYPAAISIEELLYFEPDEHGSSVNDFIEQELLAPVQQVLGRQLPDVGIFQLPVLFDTIPDLAAWAKGARRAATAAFVPDIVNMQVVNGHLLIPKPCGPRMRPADAIATVRVVLEKQDLSRLSSRLTPKFLKSKGLDKTTVWLQRMEPTVVENYPGGTVRTLFSGYQDVTDVAKAFQDGFPKVDEVEVAKRIQSANRAAFEADGRLRAGWRKLTIPEGTVDIFEAYTAVVLDALGVRAHWVDSWFYHVRFGEIHCGTNVLREPAPRRATPWWRSSPNVQEIEFEEEEPV